MAVSASQPYSAPYLPAPGNERFQTSTQNARVNRGGAASNIAGATNQAAQKHVDQVQLSPAARQAYAAETLNPERPGESITAQQSAPALASTIRDGGVSSSEQRADSPYAAYQQPWVTGDSAGEGSAPRTEPSASTDSVRLSPEAQQQLIELAQRDREVQIHEAAHAAVGGRYTGAPKLSYTTGPDGKRYATSGEVNVDMSEIPGDPAATIKKAETIHAAALAPAQPSAQDRNVAAKAMQMKATAQAELMAESAATAEKMLASSAQTASPQESAQKATNQRLFSAAIA